MRFIHLHTTSGLGLSIKASLITMVEQSDQTGGTLIRLRDGQYRHVGTGYQNIIDALEQEKPVEEED